MSTSVEKGPLSPSWVADAEGTGVIFSFSLSLSRFFPSSILFEMMGLFCTGHASRGAYVVSVYPPPSGERGEVLTLRFLPYALRKNAYHHRRRHIEYAKPAVDEPHNEDHRNAARTSNEKPRP